MKIKYLFLAALLTSCTGTRPSDIGVKEGSLKPCPESPNCVSSFSSTDQHKIQPLELKDSKKGIEDLKKLVSQYPRAVIVEEGPNYLHVEFTSLVMRYVDDVEFYLVEDEKLIHVRSASRLGHSDLGVNRDRIEDLRKKLAISH